MPTGPFLNFSCASGVPISLGLAQYGKK